eukprot:Nk52_evm5s295 gene=Nk52_evmTU5s295
MKDGVPTGKGEGKPGLSSLAIYSSTHSSLNSFSVAASVSGAYAGFSSTASMNYAKEEEINSNKVKLQYRIIDIVDSPGIGSFYGIAKYVKDEITKDWNNPELKLDQFYKKWGTHVVTSVYRGCEVQVDAEYTFDSVAEKEEISVHLEAAYDGGVASASVTSDVRNVQKTMDSASRLDLSIKGTFVDYKIKGTTLQGIVNDINEKDGGFNSRCKAQAKPDIQKIVLSSWVTIFKKLKKRTDAVNVQATEFMKITKGYMAHDMATKGMLPGLAKFLEENKITVHSKDWKGYAPENGLEVCENVPAKPISRNMWNIYEKYKNQFDQDLSDFENSSLTESDLNHFLDDSSDRINLLSADLTPYVQKVKIVLQANQKDHEVNQNKAYIFTYDLYRRTDSRAEMMIPADGNHGIYCNNQGTRICTKISVKELELLADHTENVYFQPRPFTYGPNLVTPKQKFILTALNIKYGQGYEKPWYSSRVKFGQGFDLSIGNRGFIPAQVTDWDVAPSCDTPKPCEGKSECSEPLATYCDGYWYEITPVNTSFQLGCAGLEVKKSGSL